MTAQVLAYVTTDEVKRQLGIPLTDSYHDDRIELDINAASGAIKNYMGNKSVYQAYRDGDDEPTLDSNFEPILESFTGESITQVRPEVKKAVLLLIRHWWVNDTILDDYSSMPLAVTSLLYPLRDPQLK